MLKWIYFNTSKTAILGRDNEIGIAPFFVSMFFSNMYIIFGNMQKRKKGAIIAPFLLSRPLSRPKITPCFIYSFYYLGLNR